SDDQTARLWDARTGAQLVKLRGHASGVKSVAFSPDGTCLATASYDVTARLWDARTGGPLLTLKVHTDVVRSVAFSPTADAWPPPAQTKRRGSGTHDLSIHFSMKRNCPAACGRRAAIRSGTPNSCKPRARPMTGTLPCTTPTVCWSSVPATQ